MKEPILEPLLRKLRLVRVMPHIPKNAVLLDIGCGPKASFLKYASPQIKQGFGVDFKVSPFSHNNIEVSRLKFSGELPFQDSSFDVVTMLAVLEHIEHEKEILTEIYRVLVPGGKLILTVPSVWAQPVLEFLSYKLKIVSEEEIRDHKRYYNQSKLQNILIYESGFSNFKHQYFQLWMNNFCTVVKG
ncbi:MAG: methyltransferase domain-containing protein [Nodosilinea sp. LVE1205-7]